MPAQPMRVGGSLFYLSEQVIRQCSKAIQSRQEPQCQRSLVQLTRREATFPFIALAGMNVQVGWKQKMYCNAFIFFSYALTHKST